MDRRATAADADEDMVDMAEDMTRRALRLGFRRSAVLQCEAPAREGGVVERAIAAVTRPWDYSAG